MDAIRLAGITPTGAGYEIAPHLPFARFSLRLPQIGVAASAGQLRGYVVPQQAGPLELRVRLPRGVAPASLVTWANGRMVTHRLAGRFALFRIPTEGRGTIDWALSWAGSSRGVSPASRADQVRALGAGFAGPGAVHRGAGVVRTHAGAGRGRDRDRGEDVDDRHDHEQLDQGRAKRPLNPGQRGSARPGAHADRGERARCHEAEATGATL